MVSPSFTFWSCIPTLSNRTSPASVSLDLLSFSLFDFKSISIANRSSGHRLILLSFFRGFSTIEWTPSALHDLSSVLSIIVSTFFAVVIFELFVCSWVVSREFLNFFDGLLLWIFLSEFELDLLSSSFSIWLISWRALSISSLKCVAGSTFFFFREFRLFIEFLSDLFVSKISLLLQVFSS